MTTYAIIPQALQTTFANGLKRPGSGDPVQVTINAAAQDYAALSSPNGPPSVMQVWWSMYADKGLFPIAGMRLQWLYTQREALTDLERRLFEWVNSTGSGIELSNSDRFKAIVSMRDQVQKDIDTLEMQARASRAPAVGQLTATSPNAVSPGYVDPNSPLYRGDPLRRPWNGR